MPIMRLMPTSTTGDFVTAPSTLGNISPLVIRLGVGATMLHFGRSNPDLGSAQRQQFNSPDRTGRLILQWLSIPLV